MAAAQEAESHGNEWGLTCNLQWGIYTSFQTKTHTPNSLAAAAEAPSLKIFFHGTSLKWSQRLPNQHENSQKLYNETGNPIWVWWKVNGNWGNNMTKIS